MCRFRGVVVGLFAKMLADALSLPIVVGGIVYFANRRRLRRQEFFRAQAETGLQNYGAVIDELDDMTRKAVLERLAELDQESRPTPDQPET